MIKQTIFPKIPRIPEKGKTVVVTEKLDGSNLVFFKKNGKLFIAQRNSIYEIDEIAPNTSLYAGLYDFLQEHSEEIANELVEGSAICGEWLAMGEIKYPFEQKYFMFAKANVDDNLKLYNIKYDHSLFIYSFASQVIPDYIGEVPIAAVLNTMPNKEMLDELYDTYEKIVGRDVEGFVIEMCGMVDKYVRMKRGKHIEYSEVDHKNA